jgi:L-2-hydroxyglutarate oxidase
VQSHYDVIVIGGGIVGLATAYAISRAAPGTSVAVLEKEPAVARHQSGRNSGVIHSGIYYRPGSFKARFALQGAQEMVKFCAEHGIAHEVTGKLIVATDASELPRLADLARRGEQHGIPVRTLGPREIAEHEPHVRGLAALHIGTTGVADYPAVARRLVELARLDGAEIHVGCEVLSLGRGPGGVIVHTTAGDVRARMLINCAGLHSDRIARMAGDDPGVRIIPFRGEYYELKERSRDLVRGLVYPVPDPAFPFLGVHLTRDVHGGVHVGPNAVPASAREGYRWRDFRARDAVEIAGWPGLWHMARRHWRQEIGELWRSASKAAFTAAVRRMLPDVTRHDLQRAPAGVRAQAVLADGTLVDDFLFTGSGPFVHVLNAPSPAATASLPIGREIATRALKVLS